MKWTLGFTWNGLPLSFMANWKCSRRDTYTALLKSVYSDLYFPLNRIKKNHRSPEILKMIMSGVLRESYGNRWPYWRR